MSLFIEYPILAGGLGVLGLVLYAKSRRLSIRSRRGSVVGLRSI
jgi:hypothetical protein